MTGQLLWSWWNANVCMPKLSIVIPHRGNPLGLWATLHSCEIDLLNSNHSYEYIVVTNGEKESAEIKQTIGSLGSKLKAHIHFDEPLSPPVARQRGAEVAEGELLVYLDNHVLVIPRFFDRAVANMENQEIDLLHSATKFFMGQETCFEYRLLLDYNFWGDAKLGEFEHKAYKIAMGGHGGIVVRKSSWDKAGGYGPEGLLSGYGGEEPLFDLKLWRMGMKVWIDPKLIHYHYAGARGYSRHYTDDYYTNMLVAANVIGGEKWMYKVFDSLLHKSHLKSNQCVKSNFQLLQDAYYKSAEYAKHLDSVSKYTLDELLFKVFRESQVSH